LLRQYGRSFEFLWHDGKHECSETSPELSNVLGELIDRGWTALRRTVPPSCLLCGTQAGGSGLCAGCESDLPRLGAERCPQCAAPVAQSRVCGKCLQRSPHFDRVAAPLIYAYPVDGLVHALKYQGNLACARPLAWALSQSLDAEPYPDLVIPMPIAPKRLIERGFNQAAQIAGQVAAEFGLRVDSLPVQRRDDQPQALLPWKERTRNVKGAFSCERDLTGKRVAVVDDVLTSGATLDALAAELKRAGAKQVIGWIVARTVSRSPAPRR
jgi:ComF family protein